MDNKEKVNKICGSRLREARRAKNLTQEQLAEIVHVDAKYISAIENGRRKMSAELAVDVGKVLEVRHDYLLGIDDFPSSTEKILAQRYSNNDMFDYLEYFERNDYILSTPFGDDGDTASLTFLSLLSDTHVISHEEEHYKCTNAQLHTFFQNTHQIIETMKLMLVRQFLETACAKLSEEEFAAEMSVMSSLFQEKYGEAGQVWLREQSKLDACRFDEIDHDAWSTAISDIGTTCLKELSPDDLALMQKMLKK